jgi:hypothetical protein
MENYQPAMFDVDEFYWNVLVQSQAEARLAPELPAEARMIRIDTGYKAVTVWLLDYLNGTIEVYKDAQKLASAVLEIAGKDKWK